MTLYNKQHCAEILLSNDFKTGWYDFERERILLLQYSAVHFERVSHDFYRRIIASSILEKVSAKVTKIEDIKMNYCNPDDNLCGVYKLSKDLERVR